MDIPDEVIERVTGMHPEDREYPDDVRKDFHAAAEWARREALNKAAERVRGGCLIAVSEPLNDRPGIRWVTVQAQTWLYALVEGEPK